VTIRRRTKPEPADDADDEPYDDGFCHGGTWSRRGGDVMVCDEHNLRPEDH
jgi:hypothetical protein